MKLSRLLTLIIGLTVILGLMLWMIDTLRWFYWQISYSSPLLGSIVLLLLILLLGLVIAAFVYYVLLFGGAGSKKGRRYVKPKVPQAKNEAASETLRAVRKQAEQIHDEVARQALIERSRQIEGSLQAGVLRVVVFGTGSAGKSSVVNALMGRMVGQVSAPMGTTEVGQTYSLQLKGLDRQILITDTPGICEAGVAGTEREQQARELATVADLLLFVVDNDLRQSEYEPLRILAQIGKRSLLVLNKTDLYPPEEMEAILGRLRERVQGLIPSNDVVACAANPPEVVLDSGSIFQQEPDVMPLIRRLAAVLRAEGEDLVADNILLQSSALSEEARRIIDAQRKRQADKIVEQFQWIGGGVIAVTPLPVVDVLATAAVNAQMVVEIGKIYGCELNMERGRELALSLAKTMASLGIVEGALKLVTTALQLNVATFAIGKAIQGVTAAYLTRIAGKSFIEYFRHDQDWGDGGITEVVQQQFQLNRRDEFVKVFIQDAIARVVQPLADRFDLVEEENEPEEAAAPAPIKRFEPLDDWSEPPQIQDDW
ncbi:MAG: YcjF family protein [Hormoscilla sp.]